MNFNTDSFRKNLDAIDDEDYGDFMRAANHYLNQLRQELSPLQDRTINRRLGEMQGYLQFNPNWDIKSTSERLHEDLDYIDDLLMAHQQDWESESLYRNF